MKSMPGDLPLSASSPGLPSSRPNELTQLRITGDLPSARQRLDGTPTGAGQSTVTRGRSRGKETETSQTRLSAMAVSLLLLDETAGDLPVRDSSPKRSVQDVSATAHPTKAQGLKTRMRASVAWTRQQVSQMSQAELEDGFLRLHDENLVLKEFACKQEDRIKRLGSKLLRLTHEQAGQQGQVVGPGAGAGGIPGGAAGAGMREHGPKARPTHTAPPRYSQHIAEGAAAHTEQIHVPPSPSTTEGTVAPESQLLVLAELQPESQRLAWGREMDFGEAPSQHQQALEHRATVRRNVGLIRLQRLLQEQSCELAVSRGRFAELHEAYESQLQQWDQMSFPPAQDTVTLYQALRRQPPPPCPWLSPSVLGPRIPATGGHAPLLSFFLSLPHQKQEMVRSTSEALLGQVEELTLQLKAERQKARALESQKQSISSLQGVLEEFQERIRHLEKERDLLKEDYDALLESSLAHEQRRGDVSRLEEQLSLVLAEKQQLAEELAQERGSRLQAGGKGRGRAPGRRGGPGSWGCGPWAKPQVGTRGQAVGRDPGRHVTVTRAGQAELQGVLMQAERDTRAHEEKQQKMEQLLDLRGTRIHQLEDQLKVLAYGGQLRVRPTECAVAVEEEKTPLLQSGESLLELHVAGAVLSQAALQLLGEAEPLTFCTYAFYDFETHCTPVVRGAQPRYCFTSQYVVRAEPLFLQYLQEAAARLNLHVATAADHRTLASCWLRFGERLGSGERVCATAVLHVHTACALPAPPGPSGEDCGMLEYWMRLRPKALGYFQACVPRARAAQRSRQQELEGGPELLWNELQVQIRGCAGLRGRWLGSPPSPYVMYRFFTFPDHDTPIVPSSSHPYFGDLRTFPLRPTAQLNRYLRLESLHVYVFDDEDAEPGCYLGKAQIPLLPLARGHSITGDFVLTDQARHPTGSVSLSLEWKRPYLPPGLAWANENQRTSPMEQLLENGQAAQPSQLPRGGRHWAQPASRRDDLEGDTDTAYNRFVSAGTRSNQDNPSWRERIPLETPAAREAQAGEEEADHAAEDGENLARGQHLEPRSLQDTARVEACEPALDSDAQTTDSDEIVVGTHLGSPPKAGIRIEIVSLRLHPAAEVLASEHVQQLYVEFHFPGVPLAETETPLSLRKPQSGEEIYFHFSKVILLDPEAVSTQRKRLFSMLQAEVAGQNWGLASPLTQPCGYERAKQSAGRAGLVPAPGQVGSTQAPRGSHRRAPHWRGPRLQFVVGREPLPGTRGECEDVGFAYLDLREILLSGSDVLEQELEVVSPQDHSAIGRLTVSVEAAAALRDIYWEGRRKAEEEE
nr:X-linked retinitis pigmentosa GTPase regulator-interacting protein 1 [Pelodiscus sinensis]|eukprot:XP_025039361.1 X-linked retinitis pigmentosa GTPase regulator-interacting protein 1 [Pelodiscus sinensis]